MHKPTEGGVRCHPDTKRLFHLVGGYSGRQSQPALHCYDIDKDSWEELAKMEVILDVNSTASYLD